VRARPAIHKADDNIATKLTHPTFFFNILHEVRTEDLNIMWMKIQISGCQEDTAVIVSFSNYLVLDTVFFLAMWISQIYGHQFYEQGFALFGAIR
jgi:hypothetical protein